MLGHGEDTPIGSGVPQLWKGGFLWKFPMPRILMETAFSLIAVLFLLAREFPQGVFVIRYPG